MRLAHPIRRTDLLHMIVRCFSGDDDVVDVAFAEAGVGNADEAGFFVEVGDASAAQVPHSGAQSADQLEDHGFERAAVWNPSFDAFGNVFGEAVAGVAAEIDDRFAAAEFGFVEIAGTLKVAFARALGHGGKRTHAAISLEGTALIEDGLAGAFVDAGEEGTDHDAAGSGGDGLGDVSGILDTAVGDERDVVFFGGAIGVGDSGDLRNADSSNHAGGADGARSDANFDRVCAGFDQSEGAFVRSDVAGEEVDVGEGLFDIANCLEDAGRMTVGRIDREDIDLFGNESGGAVHVVAGGADGGADS